MKRIVVLVSLLLIMAVPALADAMVIKDYRFEGKLHSNDTVEVHERIRVYFNEPQHGIYRDIPLSFSVNGMVSDQIRGIRTYDTRVTDVRVVGDQFTTKKDGGNAQVKIGNARVNLTGLKTYDIYYTYIYPEDELTDTDFLFHCVLGAQWDAKIERFSFDLAFEEPVSAEVAEGMTVFSGPTGSRKNALNVSWESDGKGVRGSVSNLPRNRMVTVFGKLPQGYFSDTARRSSRDSVDTETIRRVFAWVFAALMVGLTGFIVHLLRHVVHVDVKSGESTLWPPEGIDCAQATKLLPGANEGVGMLALVTDWAGKGIVRLEEDDSGGLKVERLGRLDLTAPEHQRVLFNELFDKSKTCVFREKSAEVLAKVTKARSALDKYYTGERRLSTGMPLAIMLMLANAVVFCMLVGCGTLNDGDLHPMGLGVLLSIFMAMTSLLAPPLLTRLRRFTLLGGSMDEENLAIAAMDPLKRERVLRRRKKARIILYVIFHGLIPCLGGTINLMRPGGNLPFWLAPLFGVAAFLNPMMAVCLIQKTSYGADVIGKVRSFRDNLEKLDSAQLERLQREDPSYGVRVLPYAIAFGLQREWFQRFDGVIRMMSEWEKELVNIGFSIWIHDLFEKDVSTPYLAAEAEAASSSDSGGGGDGSDGGGGGGGGSW